MTVAATTGLLTRTPKATGTYRIRIDAADALGLGGAQIYDVQVLWTAPNDPPIFLLRIDCVPRSGSCSVSSGGVPMQGLHLLFGRWRLRRTVEATAVRRTANSCRGGPRRRRPMYEDLEYRHLLAVAPLPWGASWEDTSEYMLGDVLVTVVLPESDGTIDPSTEDWTPEHIAAVKQKVSEGLQWWEDTLALQNSTHDLKFIVDFTFADSPVSTPYEPISRPATDTGLWVDSFLDAAGAHTPSSFFVTNLTLYNH